MRTPPLLLALTLAVASATAVAVDAIPALGTGSRILFQGDSITDGNRGRSADPNHILGHGYAFIIAARHGAAFPERKLDFLNRGVSGNTVLDLQLNGRLDHVLLNQLAALLESLRTRSVTGRSRGPEGPRDLGTISRRARRACTSPSIRSAW